MKEPVSREPAPLASHEDEVISDVDFVAAFGEIVNNGKVIDWHYWAHQMPKWTADEAARLICALDPDKYKSLCAQPTQNDVDKATEDAGNIHRLAERQGITSATPSEWVTWADKWNFSVHSALRAEVGRAQGLAAETVGIQTPAKVKPATESAADAASTPSSEDWKSVARRLADEIALKKWNLGERQITARNICESVAKELEKGVSNDAGRYHGTRGPRSGGSVRNEALKGWKFAVPSGTSGINGTNE